MTHITEAANQAAGRIMGGKSLSKAQFGTVRSALSDAYLYLGFLEDIATGKMEVNRDNAEWDRTAKKVKQAIKDVAKARNILK